MYGPFLLDDGTQKFWIKPMNCPGHIKVFQSKVHSYRDLPMRIGELGTVYRYERGGALHGMLRVRGFTQDDSHIFCSWEQAQDEIGKVFDLAMEFLRTFGYTEPVIYLSTRPERRLGTDEMWDKAEKALADALGVREVPYKIDEGGGVFYALKIAIKMKDAIGREWQGPTIQVDLNLPERFDVTFVNDKGERERAVMIHRVLFGSLERYVGGLIEHFAGNFPLWLNWEQAAIIPVRDSARPYAEEMATALRSAGFRVHLYEQAGDLRTRIKEAQQRKASYMLVELDAAFFFTLGRDALTALIRYLFHDLDLHRVGLSVVSFNDRAIAMYKAVGFEVEGIERDGVGTEDGFVDDVKMAIVKGRPRADFDPRPVTLEGEHVRLVPLRMEHAQALLEAADEDDIWRWMVPRPKGLDGYERYIRWALDQQILGTQLPFAVIRESDGVLVGTTRYAHIDPPNRTIEIGYTLYGKGARRTPVNTESKLLLLRHAFETPRANRVWLQTDKRNERSQAAIARLGAIKEGELRNERMLADGHLRTSVVFGITKDEWPNVRERLLGYLAR